MFSVNHHLFPISKVVIWAAQSQRSAGAAVLPERKQRPITIIPIVPAHATKCALHTLPRRRRGSCSSHSYYIVHDTTRITIIVNSITCL